MHRTEVDLARLGLLAALVEELLQVVETHGLRVRVAVADADGADLGLVAGVLVQVLDVTCDGAADVDVTLTGDVRLVEGEDV